MILFVTLLFIRLLMDKRLRYFETVVLVNMVLFYTMGSIYYFTMVKLPENTFFYMVLRVFVIANVLLPSFYHWMFISQYLRTCRMLPNFIWRQEVLQTIHQEKIENENQVIGLGSEFLSRHTEFDTIISTVTERIKYIKKTSLILDGFACICLIIFAVVYCEIDSFYSTLILSLL